MFILSVDELQLFGSEDKHTADAMYRFWFSQYKYAEQNYFADKSRLESAIRANNEPVHNDDDWGIGFGRPVPFGQAEIQQYERNILKSEKNFNEIKQMYQYFMKYIFTKAHEGDT